MAFFYPRTVYRTEASFNPLLRLLVDDFDRKTSRTSYGGCPARRSNTTTFRHHWQPRFDIQEISDAYVLQGELPGLSKENVSVEFPEPSTLVIRGEFGNKPASSTEPAAAAAPATAPAPAEDDAASTHTVSSTHSTYQATVEDDDDFEDLGANEKTQQTPTPEPTKAEPTKTGEAPAPAAPAADADKFWLRERRAGQFSRTFKFNAHIDHDAASANLEDGLLTIVVPKADKPEPRTIAIN